MLPNLFILGAPKCGTTSFVHWLAQHPQIFVPPIKEPLHFNSDMRLRVVTSAGEYNGLFQRANASVHRWRVDASTWYLFSSSAVPSILATVSEARFVVMVRDQADMALSLYRHLRARGYETAATFRDAWHLQDERAAGRSLPPLCRDPSILAYRAVCSTGWQIQRLLALVPADSVHLVTFGELRDDPQKAYFDALAFLGVDPVEPSVYRQLNSARVARAGWLARGGLFVAEVKRRLGIRQRLGLGRLISRPATFADPSDRAFVSRISAEFDDDRLLLDQMKRRLLSREAPSGGEGS